MVVKKVYLLIIVVLAVVVFVGWRVVQSKDPLSPINLASKTNKTSSKSSGSKSTASQFDKTKYSLSDPKSIWVVVNKFRPLNPIDYAPTDLTSVGGGQLMRKEAAVALDQLIAGAAEQGLKISPLSGYRSYSVQVGVYNNEVKKNGRAVADSESAKPGYSEHQTGFAVDVGGGGCGIEDCFGNTKEGKWLAAHAYEYGFIVRYTAAKQSVTGYRAEPWHIRYIGTELSQEMHKEGITTLEEFFGL